MAYAILRIEKHKSINSLAGADRHGKNRARLRTRSFPERSKDNKIYQKYPSLTLVQSYKKEEKLLDKMPRKNSVLVLEVLQSFSPSKREAIESQVGLWFKENILFVKQQFPEAVLLQSRLEFDEKNIHIHNFLMPVSKNKNGERRLCAKDYVGTKMKLHKLQDEYALAMQKHFDLERGKSYIDIDDKDFVKPVHQSLKSYYRKLQYEKDTGEITNDLHKQLSEQSK